MDSSDRQRKAERSRKLPLESLETHQGTDRLEAFCDGIFAIAATLLVTDIKAPPALPDPASLFNALLSLWPNYIGYALSFVYLGVYWTHHYHVFQLFKRTDHVFLKINILFLMMVSFLPFPTALLAEYLHTPTQMQRIALLIYNGSLFVTANLFLAIWLYATYRHRLIDPDLDEDFIRKSTNRYAVAPIGYGLAFLVALWNPYASLAITIMVGVYYWIPVRFLKFD